MAKRTPIESQWILESVDSETLAALATLANHKLFKYLEEFCAKYVQTKRNQILDLPTEDERKLANELSFRKGQIIATGVLIEVIRGSKKELDKRGG